MAVTESALVSQNGALLTFWLKLCTNINTVHIGVVYTKSVRESEQTSDISSQSSKGLFRKKKDFRSDLHICIFSTICDGIFKKLSQARKFPYHSESTTYYFYFCFSWQNKIKFMLGLSF